MNKRFVRAALMACLMGSATMFAVTLPLTPAIAKSSGPSVTAPVAKLLKPAADKMQANDFAGAMELIKQAQALPDQTPFDTYKINEFLGNAAIHENDYATAATAYAAMADSPALEQVTPEEKASALRVAALLATNQKNYAAGIKYAKAFIALGGAPDPKVLATMAEAYYYSQDYANAIATVNQTIAATPAGTAPDHGALEILFSAQLKSNQQDAALKSLETLVTYYNDPDNWGQIIDFAVGVKGVTNIEALHIYRLREVVKATASGDDYQIMGGVALQANFPVEADAIFQKGLSSGKLQNSGNVAAQIASARTRAAADRKSLDSFAAIAEKSPSGEFDLKLAETYYGYGRYADAVTAVRRAMKKGGAKVDMTEANMVLGEALVQTGDTAGATAAFNAVSTTVPGWAKAQHLWLLYLGNKYATTPQQ